MDALNCSLSIHAIWLGVPLRLPALTFPLFFSTTRHPGVAIPAAKVVAR